MKNLTFKKRSQAGQSIVLAVMTITFMAGIGYALVMWQRAQSRQAVQKEQHGSAEEIGKSCIDQAIYELTTTSGSYAGYTWGTGGFLAGGDEDWLTVTLPDGTTVGVHLEEIGEISVEP
ncbi:MAG: hypothetical protein COZ72_02855 [Elusimicrobia bacterium CG_4_8_14_3_um_filter_50_9]|nr:MAG: hypothetical protein COZ72_02855 [Elusimicrobia bacterium CG_4_8_14_3_um_filter_50_9]